MRYSKGCKVEVLNKQEVPSGSWRCAEVVCSNRYYIIVRYDGDATDEVALENVARNLVRPHPPVVHHQNWIPGDVIEVMHIFSWKMATVSKVLNLNCFMVRLVGSSTEFMVHKVNTRPRLSWLDEKWVLVGQGSGDHNDRECKEKPVVNYHWLASSQGKGIKINVISGEENSCFKNEKNVYSREPCIALPKSRKRGSPYSSHGRFQGGVQKYRLTEKDGGGYDRVIAGDPYSVPEKVQRYAYTKKAVGENELCSRVDNRNMVSVLHEELLKVKDNFRKFSAKRLEHEDPDTSSVGSCSITNTTYSMHPRVSAFPADNADDHSSDAESTCQSRDDDVNCLISGGEDLTAEIHRLELHAYHCTMEVLYASGPLSWEQESLITNLRISLHITNDEHLTELRTLISPVR